MDKSDRSLETLWDGLLSCQPELVRAAFLTLNSEERAMVLTHLQSMISEAGWHPEQRQSAQVALNALEGFTGNG